MSDDVVEMPVKLRHFGLECLRIEYWVIHPGSIYPNRMIGIKLFRIKLFFYWF